ncbi:MAG: GFA family protein [Pseudomonadota bacterium]|nr:GFA family protein [Pseudomonadota bacterium]
MSHHGACFCGAVTLTVSGDPLGMGYCHCRSCQSWSGGPVNAFTLWPPEAVKVTSGRHHLKTFKKTPLTERKYCGKCGGHLMSNHPTLGVVDVFAAAIPTLEFVPAMHINYENTVLPMRDGLPKYKGFPPDAGGTGEMLPE